jgi:putative oxidoreductase
MNNIVVAVSRYSLGLIYLFGAIDGGAYLFFDHHLVGVPHGEFESVLHRTNYFWVFLKFVELVGAICLLANYKPAFGLAILIPISSVICLFYLFDLTWAIPLGVVYVVSSLVLLRAYWPSFSRLFDSYR